MNSARMRAIATAALTTLLCGRSASAQVRTPDPPGSGPLLSAAQWVQSTMLGNFATAVAVVAIAVVGLMMLSGRMDWRRGAVVIAGCFILFGAATIVAGIQSAAS